MKRLPNRRLNTSFDFECNGLRYTATASHYPDGRLGEVFITNHKVNSQADSNAKDAAIILSIGLQFGVPLEIFGKAVLREEDGRASTPVGVAIDLLLSTQTMEAN